MPTGLGNKKLTNTPAKDTLSIFYAHSNPSSVDTDLFINRNWQPKGKFKQEREKAYEKGGTPEAETFWKQWETLADSARSTMPGMFEAQAEYSLNNKALNDKYVVQAFPIGTDPDTGKNITKESIDAAKIGPNTNVQILDHSGGSKDVYGGKKGESFWKEELCDAESVGLGTCSAPLYAQQFANTLGKDVYSQGYYDFWSGISPKGDTPQSTMVLETANAIMGDEESFVKTYKPQGDEELERKKRELRRRMGEPTYETPGTIESSFNRTSTPITR